MRARIAIASLLLAVTALPGWAQVRARWRLEYDGERPTTWLRRDANGEYERFWYLTYRITNPTDAIVPVHVTHVLYANQGRDLQHDVGRVDIERTRAVLDDPRRSEELLFGRYHVDNFSPDIENDLLVHVLRLGHLSPGIARESIQEFKAQDQYLNSREMRDRRVVQPGESYHGIAIFRNVDPRATRLEVQVSGLEDPMRVEFDDQGNPVYSYENRVLKIAYRFPGDEFERERDMVIFERRRWETMEIGPLAHKETLGAMVESMVEELRRAERRAALGAGEAVPAEMAPMITPADAAQFVYLMETCTAMSFEYDASATIEANANVVWRIHEWWLANEHLLRYDASTGRYVVDREPLPGTTTPARP